MDRHGKERLIGAAILVALAVAVIPELLSGPKPAAPAGQSPRLPVGVPDPVRHVTMDLATSKTTEPATQAAEAAPAPATSPAASALDAQASPPAKDVQGPGIDARGVQALPGAESSGGQAPSPPAGRPADSRPVDGHPADGHPADGRPFDPAASLPGSGAGFAVQLGSFANRGNAENLMHQLKAQGYEVFESTEGSGRTARYRVRIGPINDRDSAERTMAKLKASGHASTLIGPR